VITTVPTWAALHAKVLEGLPLGDVVVLDHGPPVIPDGYVEIAPGLIAPSGSVSSS
jgi:hypothetical protein